MPVIGKDNYWYLWDTESGGYTKTGVLAEGQTGADGAVPNISVEAVGLPAGSVPTASRSGTDENPLFSFGIPKGDTGPQGEKGDPGPQGIQGETGPAGSPGADGGYYSPAVDADGNLSWTASREEMPAVTGANIKGPKGDTGQAGADGADGAKGDKGDKGDAGADGYTPVKGTDYWTAADKTEIENDLKTWAGQQGYITAVDSALSATSENPVQNKVIYAQLGDISAALDAIINGSSTA